MREALGRSLPQMADCGIQFAREQSRSRRLQRGCRRLLRDVAHHTTARISVGADGSESNGFTLLNGITPDGRYAMLRSSATNLIAGVTTSATNSFRLDRKTGKVILLSVSSSGTPGDGPTESEYSSLSINGRIAAFASAATNLVPEDTNGVNDIFVRVLPAPH